VKVVDTGATGNVGTSVVQALAADPDITEIVGVARRPAPAWSVPKLRRPSSSSCSWSFSCSTPAAPAASWAGSRLAPAPTPSPRCSTAGGTARRRPRRP